MDIAVYANCPWCHKPICVDAGCDIDTYDPEEIKREADKEKNTLKGIDIEKMMDG